MTGFRAMMAGAAALTRPVNCLLTGASVAVGALTAGLHMWAAEVAVAAGAAALIAGAGNAINDIQDVDEDRINRPERPLPSGSITPAAAWAVVALLGVAGMGAAWWVGPSPGWVATFVAAGLVVYSLRLKRQGPVGSLLVALMAAATFPFGALAARQTELLDASSLVAEAGGLIGATPDLLGVPSRAWIPAIFAFLYHFGREAVKGIEDLEGDESRGIRTLAHRYGSVAAARVASVCLVMVGLLAWVPWIGSVYGMAYGMPVLVLNLLIFQWSRQLLTGRIQGRMSRRLLFGMALGLVAICLGEITGHDTTHSIPTQVTE